MRVLISGAGIAGPALAWGLAKAGMRVTIVEKSHAILPHGQNVDIKGSAVTAIKKMGLLEQVKRSNTKEKGTQLIDPKGRPFAPFPVKEGATVSFTSEFEILRGDLAAIFYEATKDYPNVNYVLGTTIKEVISNDDETVKVALSNGEVQEYDVLVAADGQWSKVRKQCFPPEDVKAVDMGMYAIYWTVPRLPGDNDWWNVYHALGSRIITTRPDPYGTIRAMFTFMPSNDDQKKKWLAASKNGRQAQEDLLRSEFADAGWQAQRLLDNMGQAPDFYFQAIKQIKMTKWSKSRVICLGDTAYAPTPVTGMGTTLAITGAYILAAELSELKDGEHPSKAFDAYESTFRPYVEQSQKVPSILPGLFHPGSAWKRWLFQSLLSAISRVLAIPWIARKFEQQSDDSDDDGFPLPQYPSFDEKVFEMSRHVPAARTTEKLEVGV